MQSHKVYKFKTNSRAPLEINVSEIVSELKLKNITAFSVIAESINGRYLLELTISWFMEE